MILIYVGLDSIMLKAEIRETFILERRFKTYIEINY